MPLDFVQGLAYLPSEHVAINHDATPDNLGTRLVCDLCGEFSGSCEEDGTFIETSNGRRHLCGSCVDAVAENI